MQTTIDKIKKSFDRKLAGGAFLVGAAVGSGLTAKAARQGGADFLIALSAGRVRMMGASSMSAIFPIHDTFQFVSGFAAREIGQGEGCPTMFATSVMNPARNLAELIDSIRAQGFPGVANWPTSLHLPSPVREALERSGYGFSRELALLEAAKQKGLFTIAFVPDFKSAERVAEIGVDMINLNVGWNAGGATGHSNPISIEEVMGRARKTSQAIRKKDRNIYLMLEGGPIRSVGDLVKVYHAAQIEGYVGGSTLDRIPITESVSNSTFRFKSSRSYAKRYSTEERKAIHLAQKIGFQGTSEPIRRFAGTISRFSDGVGPVQLIGESDTGRQRVAAGIHRLSGHSDNSLRTLDASELKDRQLTISLFGRVSGQTAGIRGLIDQTNIRSLVLRQTGHLSAMVQKRILRFLVHGQYRAIGGGVRKRQGLRLIFLTTPDDRPLLADLEKLLEGCRVTVPPLRERVEDILVLVQQALNKYSADRKYTFSKTAVRALQKHDWSGNFVELNAFTARLARVRGQGEIDEETVLSLLEPQAPFRPRTADERRMVLDALWRNGFHKSKTARFLGMSRKTLYNKMKKYEIDG